ncbi:MAG: PLP-dependent aminotransferase family protein [Cyanobacteria bacterium J06639_16]
MDLILNFDRTAPTPLYQQLVEELRDAVLRGRLKPNQKLPSTRLLAKSLGLSRATVTQSYDQLLSEGYLEGRHGSGTYVCAQIPDECLQAAPIDSTSAPQSDMGSLSRFGNHLLGLDQLDFSDPEAQISFRYGSPATEAFPMKLWRKLIYRHCHNTAALMKYSDAAGYLPLRAAIADYLGRARAIQCRPEQVIIVSGSQQALDLITRLTLDLGDWVAMEDPGYLGARHCFTGQGANLQGVPVDAEGINIEALSQYSQLFKLLYITPSHQFPTGAVLPLARRLALLQWAQQTGTLILEDDYDSEYRYGDRPIPALQGLDQHHTVMYVGTFSKVLFPSLRIGYLVVPSAWVSVIKRAKWLCDRQSPLLEQYALTDCLNEGHFERHIRRMRQLYNQRRQALVQALKHYLGARVTILGENAGIHLMVKIETSLPDDLVIQKAQRLGVGLISAQGYYLTTPKTGEFIFGYAQLDESQIEQGIQILAQILS